jgi:oxygen-independent coproporphyrinogen-3 oxidase
MELERRMRAGDPSVWPLWDPRPLGVDEVHDGWRMGLERRGTPGFPETVHAYAHFPYCLSSCNFCMYFHEVPREPARYVAWADYLVGLCGVLHRKLGRVEASHAYFGGGTPSAMPHEQLRRVLSAWGRTFSIEGEFSVEGHPAVTEPETLELFASHGVNRLSMGVQSLEPEVLKRITRRNRETDEIGALVDTAQRLGMVVNLDLVTGLPGQSEEGLVEGVARLMEIGPDRFTVYAYQPTARLPGDSPDLTTGKLVSDERAARAAARAGYRAVVKPNVALFRRPRDEQPLGQRSLRHEGRFDDDRYVEFDTSASQLIGVGTGAYGHVFGRAALREVTSLSALDPERPVYFGTPMSLRDEARKLLLAQLSELRCVMPAVVAAATGVDVDALLAPARADLVPATGHPEALLPRDGASEAVTKALAPALPVRARRRLPTVDRAAEALVSVHPDTTRPTGRARQWLAALGVAGQGSRIGQVWVRKVEDAEVFFAVDAKDATPVRVRVEAPGEGKALVTTPRFQLVACTRPEPLSARERAFLAYLAKATMVKDPT